MANIRKLYYFHVQHDLCEIGRDCPSGYVNADDEWQATEETLETLPAPDKMYNDSFLFKGKGPQDEEIVETEEELIRIFIRQPHLSNDEQNLLQRLAQLGAHLPQDAKTTFLQQLMGHFAALPCFSNNERVLLKLALRGTKLVACESAVIYREFLRRRAALIESFGSERYTQEVCNLLRNTFQRNEFIAGQIDLTLKPGEVGVLFLGHLHGAGQDMVKRLNHLRIPVEEENECKALETLSSLVGLSEMPAGFAN